MAKNRSTNKPSKYTGARGLQNKKKQLQEHCARQPNEKGGAMKLSLLKDKSKNVMSKRDVQNAVGEAQARNKVRRAAGERQFSQTKEVTA
jgi:hypothetical protein